MSTDDKSVHLLTIGTLRLPTCTAKTHLLTVPIVGKTSKWESSSFLDGTNVDQDEEEEVSDNAWEESGKFEGDLILNERQRRLIAEDVAEGLARNGLRDSTKRWPNNEVIFYIQREHFSKYK